MTLHANPAPPGWPAHWPRESAPCIWQYKRWRAALIWQYGPDRTAAILSDDDTQTQADLAKWRQLGEAR